MHTISKPLDVMNSSRGSGLLKVKFCTVGVPQWKLKKIHVFTPHENHVHSYIIQLLATMIYIIQNKRA